MMNNEYIAAEQDSIIIKRKPRSTKNKTVAQLNEKGMQNTQGSEKTQNCIMLEKPVRIPLSSREWDAAGEKIKWQRLRLMQ